MLILEVKEDPLRPDGRPGGPQMMTCEIRHPSFLSNANGFCPLDKLPASIKYVLLTEKMGVRTQGGEKRVSGEHSEKNLNNFQIQFLSIVF